MQRDFVISSLEAKVGGRIAGFFDTIDNNTRGVLHDRGDRLEIFLTRESHLQLMGNYALECTTALVELGFVVSVPVRYSEGGRIVPNGLKLIATPSFHTTKSTVTA